MRVLLASPYFSPHVGGVENYVLAIANGLRKKKFEVTILTTGENAKKIEKDTVADFTVYRLPLQFKFSNTPVNFDWQSQMESVIAQVSPDVVNAHTPVPYFADMVVRASNHLHIPVIVTYHNDLIKENVVLKFISTLYYNLLGTQTLSLADAIITTSHAYARKSTHLNELQNKVHIVPPGVANIQLVTVKDRYVSPYILFVGKLEKTHRHKGLKYLIDSFAKVKENFPNLRLKIVGQGDDLESYRKQASNLNLDASIDFLTGIKDEDLPAIYAGAICLCLPSISEAEGFGMVVLEAAQQQTPAIGSNIGGIPQSIQDKVTGFLCRPKDVTTLAKLISRFLENPLLQSEMGIAAQIRVQNEFLWDQQATKTALVFRKVQR